MNTATGIVILLLFALWLIAEIRCISYKRKYETYEHQYEMLRDLYNEQVKLNDDNTEFLNQMLVRLHQMDKESKAEWEAMKKQLDELREEVR